MNDPEEAEYRLLEGAVESWIPLWEAVWILRPLLPGQPDIDIVPSARGLLSSLVDQGRIYIAWLSDDGAESIEEVVRRDDIGEALSVPANWQPKGAISEPYLVMAATSSGRERYEALLRTHRP